jgi:molybdenum cofactor biosynthesis protein MoaC
MRDISTKFNSLRTAKAISTLKVRPSTIKAIKSGNVPKSDPLGVAKIAGIQAAKNTALLIPYCHQVPLDVVNVEIELERNSLVVLTEVKAIWKTGVEMEALVSASIAALTLYDMLKPIDGSMQIVSTKLLEKKGGKSGIKETGKGLKAAVLVVSDSVSKGRRKDISGKILVGRLKDLKFQVPVYRIIADDAVALEKELRRLANQHITDLILTTGGTGTGPRDVTPEATAAVLEQRLEGVEETMRSFGQNRVPTAMLSRGLVGIRGKTLIINFPGSKGGVQDGMDALFPAILHTFRMFRGEGHDR